MPAIDLQIEFPEEGSGVIKISGATFLTENDTMNSFIWSLTDTNGIEINGRTDVSQTPASDNYILLKGDDLKKTGPNNQRYVTIKGTYNSKIGGVTTLNVPYTKEYQFGVKYFTNIP